MGAGNTSTKNGTRSHKKKKPMTANCSMSAIPSSILTARRKCSSGASSVPTRPSSIRQTWSALSPWTRYPVRRLQTFLKALTPSTQDLVRRLTTTTTKTIKRKLKLSTCYMWNSTSLHSHSSRNQVIFSSQKKSTVIFLVLENVRNSQYLLKFSPLPHHYVF